MSVKRKKAVVKAWLVSEKLDVVKARQTGMSLEEVKWLFHVGGETIRKWVKAYEEQGLVGLEQTGNRPVARSVSAKTQAAEELLETVMQKDGSAPSEAKGAGKVQGVLARHGFLAMAKETVRQLLRRTNHGPIVGARRRNRPPAVKRFERSLPNELWQTDIMSFMIKGQYRVYLIGFMDDHSRFLVGWGLYRFQTSANVMEVFRAAIEKHGMPKEVLTDNGRQYYTWRGKSQFTVMLLKLGIRQIRSRPYHPQTLGKIESFWRNLFQECLSQLPLGSFEEAKDKIGAYIEYYNFKRPHQGINQVTPADRYYQVAGQVRQIIEQNTAKVEEAPVPVTPYQPPAYLVGNLGGKELVVVAKSAEVSLKEAVTPEVKPNEPNVGDNGKIATDTGGIESHSASESSETSESGGTVGPDLVGAGAGGDGGRVVLASGSIAGTVLPVDETGANGIAGRVGDSGTGSEKSEEHPASDTPDRPIESARPTPGTGNSEAAQGTGPLADGQPGGAACDRTAELGADPRGQ